jgi:hypothetical protein
VFPERCSIVSQTVGVGTWWLAFPVSDEPEPVPLVRGADGARRDAIPVRVVPERGQVPENLGEG